MPRTGSAYELAEELEKKQLKTLRENDQMAEAERYRDDFRRDHAALIESIPRGALGDSGMDPSDPTTWHKSEDAEFAAWAREVLGAGDPDLEPEGLTRSEKRVLYDASEREVEAMITPETITRQRTDNSNFEKASQLLWSEYALQFPEFAGDAQGARDAVQRLLQGSVLTPGQLASLADDPRNRDKILDMIAAEQSLPGSESRRGARQRAQWDDGYDDRTAGVGGSGSYGNHYGGGSQREEAPGSLMDGIVEWQKKTGFTRR